MVVKISYDNFEIKIEKHLSKYFINYIMKIRYSKQNQQNVKYNFETISYSRNTEEYLKMDCYEDFAKTLFLSKKCFLYTCFKSTYHKILHSPLHANDLLDILYDLRSMDEDKFQITVQEDMPCLFTIVERLESNNRFLNDYILSEIRKALEIILDVSEYGIHYLNVYNFNDFYHVVEDCISEYTLFDNAGAIRFDSILNSYLKYIDITQYNFMTLLEIIYRSHRSFDNNNQEYINFIESPDFEDIFLAYKDKIPYMRKVLTDYAYVKFNDNLTGTFDQFNI